MTVSDLKKILEIFDVRTAADLAAAVRLWRLINS
jgi:hypothetical protein